jgi:hypothetical protein
MNNENEYIDEDGISYVAVQSPMGFCAGCAHDDSRDDCETSPQCEANYRADKRNIIWVKAK